MERFFGIIGGMGTLASTQFIADMNQYYSPNTDQKYLNYVLWNHAEIPDRTAFILGESDESPLPHLVNAAQSLERMGADFIVMACNTAHYFVEDMRKESDIRIINLLELVSQTLHASNIERIGIMATAGTMKSKLFHDVIESSGKTVVEPTADIQERVNALIYEDVKGNNVVDEDKYNQVIDDYISTGAEAVILGCTELSFIASKTCHNRNDTIDSQALAVKETVKVARQLQQK